MDYIKETKLLRHLFIVLALLSFSFTQAEDFSVGKHYQVLKTATPTRDPGKVEVVEVFWFGCNHCFSLEAYLHPWKERLPKDVDFWKSHATWNQTLKIHARLFYSAKALKVEEKAVSSAFNAIQRERRFLTGNSELEYFFKGLGVDRERYQSISNSFGVDNAISQADNRMRLWAITGVPTLIVNGKYKVSPTRELGTERLLEVVDFLIEKERRFLSTSP